MNPGKLHIRSAGDLMAALGSPDMSVRLAVLQAIARAPDAAMAYGPHDGRDIVDALIHQAYQKTGFTYWKGVVGALAAFRDPRVVAFFKKIFSVSQTPEIIFLAADRLAQEPVEPLREFLSPLLLQDNSPAHARAVADLLARSAALSVAERLRVAMLADASPPDPPPLDDETADIWLAELSGVYGREARSCLRAQGEPAFAALKARWDRLSEDAKAWLLQWGVRDWPLPTVELLTKALESGSEGLALTALDCIAELGEGAALFRPVLARFTDHPNSALRLAAIRAGATGVDWRGALARESDPALRAACLARLAREEGKQAIPDLVSLLSDDAWAIRAAATQALIGVGEAAVETVKPLMHHPDPAVRAGGVQVLLALGQEEWLEQELLA